LRHAEVRVVAILVVRSVIIPVLYAWQAVIIYVRWPSPVSGCLPVPAHAYD